MALHRLMDMLAKTRAPLIMKLVRAIAEHPAPYKPLFLVSFVPRQLLVSLSPSSRFPVFLRPPQSSFRWYTPLLAAGCIALHCCSFILRLKMDVPITCVRFARARSLSTL